MTLRIDTIRLSNGESYTKEIVEHRGAVAIVPFLDAATVLMVRQYRIAVGKQLLEIPAGTLERGEDLDACAARELEEEIGYQAGTLTRLFSQYLAPGYSDEVLHAYRATNLVETAQANEIDEQIEVVAVPTADVQSMILDGRICDAKSIAALLVCLCINRTNANDGQA